MKDPMILELAKQLDSACVGQTHLKDTCKALGISYEMVKQIIEDVCPKLLFDATCGKIKIEELQAHSRIHLSLGILLGKKLATQ